MNLGVFTNFIKQSFFSNSSRSFSYSVGYIVILGCVLLGSISQHANAATEKEADTSPVFSHSNIKPPSPDRVINAASSELSNYKRASTTLPPWPLKPLSQENRKALIKFLVNKGRYKVAFNGNNITEDKCADFLDAIRNDKAEILSPVTVRATPEKKLNGELAKCTATAEFRTFSNAKEEASTLMSDPAFRILPPAEQARRADFIFQATANMEYYDLSAILGKGIWGHLGEGVVRTCLPSQPDFCKRFVGPGYAQYKGTLFNTVDIDTCAANYYTQSLFTQRIIGENEHKYSEVPSVVAFLKIEDGLYFFDANGVVPWQRFNSFANEKNTEITLVPLNAPSAGNQSAKNFCFYKED